MNIFLVTIFITIMWIDLGQRKRESADEKSDGKIFNVSNTNLLKGICAFLILLHHITQNVKAEVFIYFGYLGVAGFLFISGFGMTCQWKKKGGAYADKILKKTVPMLAAMCFVTIAYLTVYYTLMGEPLTINDFFMIFHGNKLLNWYFTAIIAIYFFYMITVKQVEKFDRKLLRGETAISPQDSYAGKKLLLYVFVFLTLWNIFLGILYIKGVIGIWWFESNYAFGGVFAPYIRNGYCKEYRRTEH